jgi:hypothetical protein
MARITLISITDKPAHHRERHSPHHDSNQELPGWSPERPAKDERPLSSLTANAGHDRWAERAAKHSFGSSAARSTDEIAEAARRRARITTR